MRPNSRQYIHDFNLTSSHTGKVYNPNAIKLHQKYAESALEAYISLKYLAEKTYQSVSGLLLVPACGSIGKCEHLCHLYHSECGRPLCQKCLQQFCNRQEPGLW